MIRFASILRFLALMACLVPFTSAQQVAWAAAPLAPVQECPGEPANEENEEDDEREESEGKERHAATPRHAPPTRAPHASPAPARDPHQTHLTRPRTSAPVPLDHLRNGLGTFYRC